MRQSAKGMRLVLSDVQGFYSDTPQAVKKPKPVLTWGSLYIELILWYNRLK